MTISEKPNDQSAKSSRDEFNFMVALRAAENGLERAITDFRAAALLVVEVIDNEALFELAQDILTKNTEHLIQARRVVKEPENEKLILIRNVTGGEATTMLQKAQEYVMSMRQNLIQPSLIQRTLGK